jgi:hypothetical protein
VRLARVVQDMLDAGLLAVNGELRVPGDHPQTVLVDRE